MGRVRNEFGSLSGDGGGKLGGTFGGILNVPGGNMGTGGISASVVGGGPATPL